MSDDRGPEGPQDGDGGVQAAPGERRRRRLAERAGQVDLDATMSQWPVTYPPSSPRPVVRPARPSLDGVATAPVRPSPGQLVVGPLVEARRARATTGSSTPPADGRRSRRRGDTASDDPSSVATVAGQQPAARDVVADRSSTQTGTDAAARGRRAAERSAPFPGPIPTPIRFDGRGHDDPGARGSGGPRGSRLSWPPGPREVALATAALAVILLVVVLLVQLLGGDDVAAGLGGDSATTTAGGDLAGSTEPISGDLP